VRATLNQVLRCGADYAHSYFVQKSQAVFHSQLG
jgi:hypothetical protein